MATLYQTGVKILTTLLGTERVLLDDGGAVMTVAPVQVLDSYNTVNQQNYQANASAVTFTALVANIIGGASGSDFITLNLTGAPGGAANITTPTALALAQGFTQAQVNQTWVLRIINTANTAAWTLVGGTGVTVNGTATVATGTWRDFLFTITAITATGGVISPANITAATITAQSIGSGTL